MNSGSACILEGVRRVPTIPGGIAMKKLFAVAALVALCSVAAFAGQWTGYISDEKCASAGAKSAKASDWINPKAFESCAQKCAKEGSKVIFLTEDNKQVALDADSLKKVMPLLGHRVSVTGTMENGTLKVDTVTGIAMEAQSKLSDLEQNMHGSH
jgi:hypothetical protein